MIADNMTKPYIWKIPGDPRYCCSIRRAGKTFHGFGVSFREAYMDWCVQMYDARPQLEPKP